MERLKRFMRWELRHIRFFLPLTAGVIAFSGVFDIKIGYPSWVVLTGVGMDVLFGYLFFRKGLVFLKKPSAPV